MKLGKSPRREPAACRFAGQSRSFTTDAILHASGRCAGLEISHSKGKVMQSLLIAAWISLVLLSSPLSSNSTPATTPPAADKSAEAQIVPDWLIGRPIDFNPIEQADPDKLEADNDLRPSIAPDEILPGGQRRVFQSQCIRIPAKELEKLVQAGKPVQIDPQT